MTIFNTIVSSQQKPAHLTSTTQEAIVFDYANTLSSDLFFQICPTGYPAWRTLFEKHVFSDPRNLTDWCKGILTRNEGITLIVYIFQE